MKKLCIGVNGEFEEIKEIVNGFDCVGSIYTSDFRKNTAGGRNSSYLNDIHDIKQISDFAKEKKIDYYVANNHTVLINTLDDDQFWEAYKEHIVELESAGITGIITGHPFMVEFIKRNTKLKVCVSTTAEIATTRAARYYEDIGADMICPSYSINYDLDQLLSIKNCLKHATIKLLVNEMCIGDCLLRRYHQNAHHSKNNMDKDYGNMCHKMMIKSPSIMLQNNTIRPEDIHNYLDITDNFKISLRQPPFFNKEKNMEVVKAYAEESYNGNYIDLMSQKLAQTLYISNKELDGLFKVKTQCAKNCHECDICKNLYRKIAV